jgi:hypothetical protein
MTEKIVVIYSKCGNTVLLVICIVLVCIVIAQNKLEN